MYVRACVHVVTTSFLTDGTPWGTMSLVLGLALLSQVLCPSPDQLPQCVDSALS